MIARITRDAARVRSIGLRPLLRGPGLALAAGLLLVSVTMPWWRLDLHAPQYPKGLKVVVYLTRIKGDVFEINTLNHYIGMMPLDDAAELEKSLVPYVLPAFAGLALLAIFLRGKWRWLAALPLILFPVAFMIDLQAWLYIAGHTLDPRAPLSSSIKPFTPKLLGTSKIGQFTTTASFEPGFWLAVAAAVLAVVALVLEREGKGRRV